MITLTTPQQVNSVLGGNSPVAYDKLVIAPFNMSSLTKTIAANLRLTSTTTPLEPIMGTLKVVGVAPGELVISVPQLNITRRIALDGGQMAAVVAQIESAQAALENGLVALGAILGTRTAGV
jgi:hypothetical protein